jgi:tRNA (mo5U34)-methyltransferase
MPSSFPPDCAGFLLAGQRVEDRIRDVKGELAIPDYGWYPYESLSALPLIASLLAPAYDEIAEACIENPIADLGCADGDLAAMFAQFGADVDAIDHRESNFNQMRGVETMARALELPIRVHDVDLDGPFELPRRHYGLTLFLGTLYHLKNPFYVLETLASLSDWCILSTRVAQVTPDAKIRIDKEPVAYLLAAREANDDPTNFWIFSPAGLVRLLNRTGWMVAGEQRVGCETDSDPVHTEADERMFVLLKSRTRHPELHVRPIAGWYAPEQDEWRWTSKRFSLQVNLPQTEPVSEFALRFNPPEMVFAKSEPFRLQCHIEGDLAGSISCETADTVELRGRFPERTAPGAVFRLDFTVESSYRPPAGDARELGIVVPLLDRGHANTSRIPLRIS